MNPGFSYSKKYYDDNYEYRQVTTSSEIGKMILEKGVLAEEKWRELGITMSKGWVHYTISRMEPNILLFRRPIGTDGSTGQVSQEMKYKLLAENSSERKKIPCKFNK